MSTERDAHAPSHAKTSRVLVADWPNGNHLEHPIINNNEDAVRSRLEPLVREGAEWKVEQG